MTTIGNSGFKYIEIDNIIVGRKSVKTYTKTCIIKYIKINKELFRLIGKSGTWGGRGTGAIKSKDTIAAKRFLGLDNRYYYIEVSHGKVIWGQIQSSGAVIAEDRTIIKQLDFFPMNIETPTVPVIKTISVTPINPAIGIKSEISGVIPDTPPIKSLIPVISDESVIKQLKEIEWIEQIMNQIYQVMNQINQMIQLILNQLKRNK